MKTDKLGILLIIFIVLLLFILTMAARAQEKASAQSEPNLSGGVFSISKTVIAGGGAETQNQIPGLKSTAGQAVAGGVATGGNFSLTIGFWTPENFAPTAATATIGGRVITAQGNGIRNAAVTILFPSGEIRTTQTGSLGFYRFNDVEVGAVYILTVSSRRFAFSQTTQVLTVNENRDDINFIAVE